MCAPLGRPALPPLGYPRRSRRLPLSLCALIITYILDFVKGFWEKKFIFFSLIFLLTKCGVCVIMVYRAGDVCGRRYVACSTTTHYLSICVCVCIYLSTCVCMYVYLSIYVCMYVCTTNTHTCMYVCVSLYVCMYTNTHTCMYVYVSLYVCMCDECVLTRTHHSLL